MESIVKLEVKQVRVGVLEGVYAKVIRSPKDAFDILLEYIGDADREHFVILCVDSKNRINAIHTVSIGTLNSALVHPREVFKLAILHNACGLVLSHCHPSGDPSPSPEDISITQRLIDAGKIMGIDILDHIVVGNGTFCSIREQGLLEF